MARKLILGALIGLTAAVPVAAYSQKTLTLKPSDYTAIEQLTARYPYEIDHCSNNGYDYADMYTKDGIFGVSSGWNTKPKIWYRGREQLAEADGGGRHGCKPMQMPTGFSVRHIVTSQVITATPTGARGKSTLLAWTSGYNGKPPKVEWQGGYEDVYVKTVNGWRFKSRVHVWPGHTWPDTAAEQAAIFQKEYRAMERRKK